MRRIREILRLCWDLRLGQTKVAKSLGVSSSTVNRLLARASAAGLSWPLAPELDDTALEKLLYPVPEPRSDCRPEPDWSYVHTQLKMKGVTLSLLWQEYKEQHPDGFQISQFCELYRRWRSLLNVTMRQTHLAGEKAFSDFAGAKFRITNPNDGSIAFAHLFVCALGASSFTFAEAYLDETSESWCDGQAAAFKYFQGVPAVIVPDNPKAAINKPSRYEPELNDAFAAMANHFRCAVIPARVRHPKDKAKVEAAVGLATRWILAKLRNRTFFSLDELRIAIRPLLKDLNEKPFKKLPGSRRTAFESIDKPALRPLPVTSYEYYQLYKTIVAQDYHVDFEQHWYSVPHALIRKQVELRVTANAIEIFHAGQRVASHVRSNHLGGQTTLDIHRTRAHSEYAQRSPARLIDFAAAVGPATKQVIQQNFESKMHAEQAYKCCSGILRLGKTLGNDRLENACVRGLASGAVSFRSIESILKTGLDRRPLKEPQNSLRVVHANIRGAAYFVSQKGE